MKTPMTLTEREQSRVENMRRHAAADRTKPLEAVMGDLIQSAKTKARLAEAVLAIAANDPDGLRETLRQFRAEATPAEADI